MDKNRFDGFTRQLAHRENRRQAIKTLFAGGLGTAAAVVVGSEAEAAKTDCCPVDRPTLCNFTCTDTIYDEQNCGDCGVNCPTGERCWKGVCESESIVHCTTVADCPGSNTECSTITCKKGVCGVSYAANGKRTPTQIAGDCQRNVCDGAGNVISIVDNNDKPLAQNECTTGICVDGVPHQNMRPAGRACSTGKCDGAGQCSPTCTSASQCPPSDNECQTSACLSGICGFQNKPAGTAIAQQTAGDCQKNVCDGNGNVTSIADNTDTPPQPDFGYGTGCVESICISGAPEQSNKPAGAECSDDSGNRVCDGEGNCVGCLEHANCPETGIPNTIPACIHGHCMYQCIDGYDECIPNGGGCVDTMVDSNHCGACDNPCPAGRECTNGVCSGCVIATDCPDTDTECQYRTCDGGVCGTALMDYGTATTTQTPYDCHKNVCDGAGSIISIVDDLDAPPYYYGDECLQQVCNAGNLQWQPISAGSPCSFGICDSDGNCVGCLENAHCSSVGIGQADPVCSGGHCSYVCHVGWGDCQPGSGGCETNLMSDNNHCGLCHRPCPDGQQCQNGTCV